MIVDARPTAKKLRIYTIRVHLCAKSYVRIDSFLEETNGSLSSHCLSEVWQHVAERAATVHR